jgi:hypothetical protein
MGISRSVGGVSPLPPKADVRRAAQRVRFVPLADIAVDKQQAGILVGKRNALNVGTPWLGLWLGMSMSLGEAVVRLPCPSRICPAIR